ncbi:MAG: HEAT repeat domain-containing protein [Nitrospirae bacterium]|nr:HEAT repeat domain-containing protein [Nitrospirota bacterium]
MIQRKNVLKLIKDLSHHDSAKRRGAAENLSGTDERAVYPLIRAMRDESAGVQDAAMRSLINLGGEITAYMVLPLLREDSYLRNTAMLILREIGAESVPLLYPLLKDKDDDIRKFAIDLLATIRDGVEAERLLPLIHDPNANVRASAAKAVGVLGYTGAVPHLAAALKDEEWVCFSVLEAIGELKDESSVDAISGLLSLDSEAMRYAAIETLGKIGSPLSGDALMRHMKKAGGFEKTAAIRSLLLIGVVPRDADVYDALMDMFINGDWDDKIISLRGIAEIRNEASVRTIVDIGGSLDPSEPENEGNLYYIKDALMSFGCSGVLLDIINDPKVKFRGKVLAIETIRTLRCRDAVPALISLISGDIRDVRRASIEALGNIRNEESVGALIDAVDDYDSHVRRAAVGALGEISDKEAFQPILSMLAGETYPDVIEEAVKALLSIDPEGFRAMIGRLDTRVQEIAGWYADQGIS